ncbi:MAG TPA: hypothetical protein VGL06_03195 [Pseudonocardiaceae bacterium]
MDLAAAPQPPPGQGPVLACYRPVLSSRTKFWQLARGIAAVLVASVLFVLIPGLPVWTLVWLLLVTLAYLGITIVLIRLSGRRVSSAGAEWYSTGNRWVRVYELVQVTMSQGSRRDAYLRLVDVHGNELQVSYAYLRRNRLIWDLVYNGILHSVIAGNARTNMSSRAKLDLPSATP